MVRYSDIDEKDFQILQLLELNSRMPYTQIAKKVNLSEAGVRKRIRKLEKYGIIKRYTIEIDYKKIGYKLAWVGIDIRPEKLYDIIDKIKGVDSPVIIRNVYTSMGDHDLMLEVIYKSQKDLFEFSKSLEKLDGIEKICPAELIEKI